MRVGSLFAGVGGFDIAAGRAGMEVAWQSEVDKHASKVLEHYWPGKNLGDINEIRQPAAVDVLCGGFPCQSYSVAGNRGGLADDRGALWWQYTRLIDEIRPTWVVGENVPGLLSSRGGQDFEEIVASLVERGYGVVWGVLDAQYFGVAQRRRRLFIVGHSDGQPRPEILALAEGMFGHPRESREAGDTIALNASQDPVSGSESPTLGTNVVMAVRTANTGANGIGVQDDAAYTLDGGLVRRFTPLECERLQGFPDGWTDIAGSSDRQRYKQMGNAVAVPVVEWILKRIAATEREDATL